VQNQGFFVICVMYIRNYWFNLFQSIEQIYAMNLNHSFMKLLKVITMVTLTLGMFACSKQEVLEKPQNGIEPLAVNQSDGDRYGGPQRYWGRCKDQNGEWNGRICIWGGWGCGAHHNSPRCITRNAMEEEAIEMLSSADQDLFFSGQFNQDFVRSHHAFFTKWYDLGLGIHPDILIQDMNNH